MFSESVGKTSFIIVKSAKLRKLILMYEWYRDGIFSQGIVWSVWWWGAEIYHVYLAIPLKIWVRIPLGKVQFLYQDSLDKCPMPINADQHQSKLKADRPHPRNYPHTPTDDRRTDGQTNRRTDGRTLPSTLSPSLRGR